METLISRMHKFQQERGVENQCVTNVQFLYDTIKHSPHATDIDVKARACLVLETSASLMRVVVHLVISVDDATIDPSYDIASLKTKDYYFSLPAFLKEAVKRGINLPLDFKKDIVEKFIVFLDLARRVNAGELLVTDKTHYNDQADFLQAEFPPGNPGLTTLMS